MARRGEGTIRLSPERERPACEAGWVGGHRIIAAQAAVQGAGFLFFPDGSEQFGGGVVVG